MSEPWYRDGLRFECTRCGHCCSGTAGTVLVSDREIEALAALTGLSPEQFREVYTRRLRDGDVTLREKSGGDCIFFERGRGCTVYPARPRQCRTWPFWQSVVHSPERWAEEAEGCPGMNQGQLHPADAIRERAATDGTRGIRGEKRSARRHPQG